jgi:drug/metabolite transporter (DMT)-like permease
MVRADPSLPDTSRARFVGVGLIVLSACLYGTGPFFARVAYDAGMTPLPLLTWRYAFAAILGWVILALSPAGRRSLATLTPRRVAVIVVLGLIFVGNTGTYTAALQTVPVGLVAIITYLYPALVAVVSIRYARRLEGRRAWLALTLSTTGVVLAVGGIPAGADIPVSGLVLAFLCPIFYTVWIVATARLRGERPDGTGAPIGATPPAATGPDDAAAATEGPDALAMAALMTTVTAVAAAGLSVLVGADPSPGAVPRGAWLAAFGFGAFSAIALVAFLGGTKRIGAARAGLVSTIEPVYTIVLATILLGEVLTPIQALGGLLVVCGVLLAESGRIGRTEDPVRVDGSGEPAPATEPGDPGPVDAADRAPGPADRATV